MDAHAHERVDLVLCRLAAEDVSWLTGAFTKQVRIFVYNAGHQLQLVGQEATGGAVVAELLLPGASHETHCYLNHIQRAGQRPSAFTVFAPAQPRCKDSNCKQRLVAVIRALSRGHATLEPNGFAPIEPSPLVDFWHDLPRHLMCIKRDYEELSNGRDFFTDVEFTSFSPMGAFAVARNNLMSVPRGWLRRADAATTNVTRASTLATCCSQGCNCVPWLMERLWPMLLGTAATVRSPSPLAPVVNVSRSARLIAAALGRPPVHQPAAAAETPHDSPATIRLRLDSSRVARVARLANSLTDDERTVLFEQLDSPIGAAQSSSCSTQLCAIRELIRTARSLSEQDGDFAQYLAAAVNTSTVSERAVRRCRAMLTDVTLMPRSVERIQVWRIDDARTMDDRRAGELLHTAIVKVYSACVDQMVQNPRWSQRPFVYGFARTQAQVGG